MAGATVVVAALVTVVRGRKYLLCIGLAERDMVGGKESQEKSRPADQ